MKLLTNSKNLIEELKKIHIERSEELIEYLPYRYESFDYTDENELEDAEAAKKVIAESIARYKDKFEW